MEWNGWMVFFVGLFTDMLPEERDQEMRLRRQILPAQRHRFWWRWYSVACLSVNQRHPRQVVQLVHRLVWL